MPSRKEILTQNNHSRSFKVILETRTLELGGMKMRDRKMEDQVWGKVTRWKMQDWKMKDHGI